MPHLLNSFLIDMWTTDDKKKDFKLFPSQSWAVLMDESRGRVRERYLVHCSIPLHNNPQLIVWKINLATNLLRPFVLYGRLEWPDLWQLSLAWLWDHYESRGTNFLLFHSTRHHSVTTASLSLTTIVSMQRTALNTQCNSCNLLHLTQFNRR